MVLQPAKANDELFKSVTFLMPNDGIVEFLQEVFRWRLNVNDSRVRLNSYTDTQVVILENRDGKLLSDGTKIIIALLS